MRHGGIAWAGSAEAGEPAAGTAEGRPKIRVGVQVGRVRAIAYVTGGRVRLVSRSDRDMTGSYPELAVLAGRIDTPVILDGEIVALRAGRPDFGLLQTRMHVRQPPASLVRETPVQLYVFDLLHRGGESLLGVGYTGRRARLEDLGLDEGPVRTPPWYRGGADDILAVSQANGLEGIVGKPLAARYHPGARGEWIKVKNIRPGSASTASPARSGWRGRRRRGGLGSA